MQILFQEQTSDDCPKRVKHIDYVLTTEREIPIVTLKNIKIPNAKGYLHL